MGLQLTETAITKVKEIIAQQDPHPAGLRIGVGVERAAASGLDLVAIADHDST